MAQRRSLRLLVRNADNEMQIAHRPKSAPEGSPASLARSSSPFYKYTSSDSGTKRSFLQVLQTNEMLIDKKKIKRFPNVQIICACVFREILSS
jgi:hypothetical protein